jgi:hypothetical protein
MINNPYIERATCDRFFQSDIGIWLEYTGAQDVQGKEICVGDILTEACHKLYYIDVYYGGPHLVPGKFYGQKYNSLISHPTCEPQTYAFISENLRVIGNIYENLELIKND